MRRQCSRQPLVIEKKSHTEEKVINENTRSVREVVPDFKDGPSITTPSPYVVPPNESASKIYIPLIKNVIKKEEFMWKDGYVYTKITEDTTWKEYVLGGIDLIKQKAGIVVEGDWKSQPYLKVSPGTIGFGLCPPITLLGDGVEFLTNISGVEGIPKNANIVLKDPLFTITNSMTIIFSGNHWGYAFLLRLIDERIENAAGKYDPQVVCYSPTTHVIKASCQGWYNWNLQRYDTQKNNSWYYNLSMRGEVDLLYEWNKLNKGGELVTLATDSNFYELK